MSLLFVLFDCVFVMFCCSSSIFFFRWTKLLSDTWCCWKC